MRFDLVTIFPEFFSSLDVSLIGKARQSGLIEIGVHNLRDWADGRHLSVDDAPSGGGAGMVMRADVWGRALDEVLGERVAPRQVLAIPTPSGRPLTQRTLEHLADADQIVVACGRYEGIDGRVADHYRDRGVEVLEFSLGDYVLNGGEVAALALVEGVGRLVQGVVGNEESLAEESHSSEGLLEYPVHTRPNSWRGLDVPQVLFSGDHARIARWRRDESLRRTARRRPDMVRALGRSQLDAHDREVLAREGFLLHPSASVRFDAARGVGGEGFVTRASVLRGESAPNAEDAQDAGAPERVVGEEMAWVDITPAESGRATLRINVAKRGAQGAEVDASGWGVLGGLLRFTADLARERGFSALEVPGRREDKKLLRRSGFVRCGDVFVRDLTA